MRAVYGLLIPAVVASLALGSPRVEVKRGNAAAEQGQSDAAILHYKRAFEQQGDSTVISYNLGNVLYGQGDFDGAGHSFLGALDPKDPPVAQSQVLYNLGNSLFQKQQYDKALAAYVESLKRNLGDEDLRYNLELARRMMRQQQQQQQSQNQDQEQKQDQQQDQQQQQQQQQEQPEQDQPPPDQRQEQPQLKRQMTEEEAERLLNALLQDEQEALKDVRKAKARAKREKDW